MRLCLVLAVSLVALALAPTADAWPPVCIEKGADLAVVNAGVVVNCGVHAYAEVCVPTRGCTELLP